MKAKILMVEGKRAENAALTPGLARKGYQLERVAGGGEALASLDQTAAEGMPDLVIFHAASMRTSGRRVCQSIRTRYPKLPILLISDSKEGEELLKEGLVNDLLFLPFTLPKLINRIRPLLPAEPKDRLQVGLLQLDTQQRWVRIGERQASLTPRLIVLLKILMQHAGEVVARKELFCAAWDTTYTKDTRTLDVHISWLREKIEEDPHHPKYLITVRGVGYRLDVI